ncbi:NrsF family protein [Chenggangzhangella methanolivorans]|uniref:NrsF family protein n=1 Tax=Chenggangzhangella methanolivorans TaxID=1437009 RepID=A0A9E6UQ28_9HYPH|nr:NrsF family protein [Chenggangzhangella methanolivorans]QZO02104.1 NrsF family protein [Chenggangzhangella methanolivorans]
MRTEDLIRTIALDADAPRKRLLPAVAAAVALAAVFAGFATWTLLGARPPVDPAFAAIRYPLKFVITGSFVASAGLLVMRLARPGARLGAARIALIGAVVVFAITVVVELAVTPSALWWSRTVGRNALLCLACVPIISAVPLAVILIALRRGAPNSPGALGAAAGLLAGAVGATFYAMHCPDDSPLFLAVWYSLAVALMTVIGSAAGARMLRW